MVYHNILGITDDTLRVIVRPTGLDDQHQRSESVLEHICYCAMAVITIIINNIPSIT